MEEKHALQEEQHMTRPLTRFRIVPTYDWKQPTTWDRDTPPFAALRYRNQNREWAEIHQALNKHSIHTLEQLKNKIDLLDPKLTNWGVSSDVLGALNRVRRWEKPEDVLGGLLFYDESCVNVESFHFFSKRAVSVSPVRNCLRSPRDSTVTGSTGSGKTVFALWNLLDMVYPYIDGKQFFRMHFRAEDVMTLMSRLNISLQEAVITIVQDKVTSELSTAGFGCVHKLRLHLHVIIDEAGGESYWEHFGTDLWIRGLALGLENMAPYAFEGAHVTVVGTSLETNTRNAGRYFDMIKFQMKPWSLQHFDSLAQESFELNRKLVAEVVKGSPILRNLASNALCAIYLFESIHRASLIRNCPKSLKRMDGIFVSEVAEKFIKSCGVGNLNDQSEKLAVVGSVFRMVDKAVMESGVAFFPRFDDLASERLRSIALSLLDVQTTSDYGKLRSGSDYSVSISLALTIAMVELLNPKTMISWDLTSLDVFAMLGEWKRMVAQVSLSHSPQNTIPSMVQVQLPFPRGDAFTGFSIPVANRHVVLQNSSRALYANVVAPFRLLRIRSDRSTRLDWAKEMGELGISNQASQQYVLQQAATSVFHTLWERERDASSSNLTLVKIEKSQQEDRLQRNQHYPFQAFSFGEHDTTTCDDWMWCQVDASGMVTCKPSSARAHKLSSVPALKPFGCQPVTAVFVTNGRELILQQDGTADFVVEAKDVDWEGQLKEKKVPDAMMAMVRENVQIRFLFCGDAEVKVPSGWGTRVFL